MRICKNAIFILIDVVLCMIILVSISLYAYGKLIADHTDANANLGAVKVLSIKLFNESTNNIDSIVIDIESDYQNNNDYIGTRVVSLFNAKVSNNEYTAYLGSKIIEQEIEKQVVEKGKIDSSLPQIYVGGKDYKKHKIGDIIQIELNSRSGDYKVTIDAIIKGFVEPGVLFINEQETLYDLHNQQKGFIIMADSLDIVKNDILSNLYLQIVYESSSSIDLNEEYENYKNLGLRLSEFSKVNIFVDNLEEINSPLIILSIISTVILYLVMLGVLYIIYSYNITYLIIAGVINIISTIALFIFFDTYFNLFFMTHIIVVVTIKLLIILCRWLNTKRESKINKEITTEKGALI